MTALAHSYYDVLGVARTATRAEILEAAQALHDLPGADVACTVLLDDARRAVYDRDLDALARSYVDVAHALPLDALGKLEALSAWLAPAKPRARELDDWATHHSALDGEGRR